MHWKPVGESEQATYRRLVRENSKRIKEEEANRQP